MNDMQSWPDGCFVLIPAYNAFGTLPGVLTSLASAVPNDRILIVDDASVDGTDRLQFPAGTVCIRHEVNQGKGAALNTGFKELLARGAQWIITMDADGQHSVEDLPALLSAIAAEKNAGIIIGRRDMRPGIMPLSRILSNRMTSGILSFITGAGILDSQCGYRAYNTAFLKKITVRYKRFEMETEVIIKAVRLGFGVSFIPIKTLYQGEPSNISHVADTLRWIKAVISIRTSVR